jgi:serine/threonine protein kinase
MLFEEGSQVDRYLLLRLLGSGGMGEVYLAEQANTGRQVALKVIRTEASAKVDPNAEATKVAARPDLSELKAVAMFNHPYILPLQDFGERNASGAPFIYLVMPFCQDGSFAAWSRQRNTAEPLSPVDVAHFLYQAAGVLSYAHEHQVVHQRVKPSNFLIRSNRDNPNRPDLLLAELGVARLNLAAHRASQSIGSAPAYIAPEQWGDNPVPATDQYALAAIAYELLTGRALFQGSPGQMMYQHFNVQPQPPSTLNPRIPPVIDGVLLPALAKRPENRFASIAVFARAFQNALSPARPAISSTPFPPPASIDPRMNPSVSNYGGVRADPGGTPADVIPPASSNPGTPAPASDAGVSSKNLPFPLPASDDPDATAHPSLKPPASSTEAGSTGEPYSPPASPVVSNPDKPPLATNYERIMLPPDNYEGSWTPASGTPAGNAWAPPGSAPQNLLPPSDSRTNLPSYNIFAGSAPPDQLPPSGSDPRLAFPATGYGMPLPVTPIQSPSGDTYVSVSISSAEAQAGTSRILNLPGGRLVTVSIPPGAYNGQIIRLEGYGEPSRNGWQPGALFVSISIAPPGAIPTTPPAARRRLSGRAILLIGLALLLVIASGVGIFSLVRANQIATAKMQATATANAKVTSTVIAQTTATAVSATATFVAGQNPYPPNTGTLALDDPLSSPATSQWSESFFQNISCKFQGGSYHIQEPNQGSFVFCTAKPIFSNFAFQVQMTIIQGDEGGIAFRSSQSSFYIFRLNANGAYNLELYSGGPAKVLSNGSSSAMKTGLNQANLVAVVAQGNTFDLYVNMQHVVSVKDSSATDGRIGLAAVSNANFTEVTYSNAKVWTL